MKETIAQLRQFVKALKKRVDIKVKVAKIGKKATKSALANLVNIPSELVDFYREMNGIHIEWEFIEPSGSGCLHIPSISEWTKFTEEGDHEMNFGANFEALILDNIQAEAATYLVRDKTTQKIELLFANQGEGARGVIPATSIQSYLEQAMLNGLVHYWPRCFQANEIMSYGEQEAAIKRFQAAPIKPQAIRKGVRVEFKFFSESGRGLVLDIHEAPENEETAFWGRRYAQIQFDEGAILWHSTNKMKVHKKLDAYEKMRNGTLCLGSRSSAFLLKEMEQCALSIGPLLGYSQYDFTNISFPDNARLAAGVLANFSLKEGVVYVTDLYHCCLKEGIDLTIVRSLELTGEAFNKNRFKRARWNYRIADVFKGLFGGLTLLAHHEAAREKKAGNELVEEALLVQIPQVEETNSLLETLRNKEILAKPIWARRLDQETRKLLGFDELAEVVLGTGA